MQVARFEGFDIVRSDKSDCRKMAAQLVCNPRSLLVPDSTANESMDFHEFGYLNHTAVIG